MRRIFYILIVASILIVVLFNLPDSTTARMNNFLRDAILPLSRPMAHLLASGRGLFQNEQQPANHVQLLAEIAQLRMELRQAQVMEQENRALRQMLGLSAHVGRRLIAAEIIVRDVNAWWQTARLNKGSVDGIALDMAVITSEGLAGRIIRNSRTTSDVLFLVDPACRIAARLTRLDAFGIVRGQGVSWRGQASCRMDFISKVVQIMPGDEVVTSGLGGVYPPGLVIGHVDQVHLDPSGLYQSADIVPTSNFRSLDLMFVMSNDATSPRSGASGHLAPGADVEEPRMMNLVIMVVALLIGAVAQQVLPGLTLLGQAKAPLVLSVVLYYAFNRSLVLLVTAAIAGGLLCDSLEALPMGYSSTVFCVLGMIAWLYREVVFSARGVTHMVFGLLCGLGLTLGLYGLLLISEESLRDAAWLWIALKAIGTALLGMILAPIVFAILERLDRLTGNIVVESPT